MRYIANIKLSNGYRMSVFVEGVSNINDAKMAVITNSVVLPEQYQIKKTDDISIEKWVSKSENKTSGRAVYAYYFVKNRELINNGNMNAAGVKTAFNSKWSSIQGKGTNMVASINIEVSVNAEDNYVFIGSITDKDGVTYNIDTTNASYGY